MRPGICATVSALVVTIFSSSVFCSEVAKVGRLNDTEQQTSEASLFEALLFRVLGDCENVRDGSAFFRSTVNIGLPAYAYDELRRGLVVSIRLNLFSDGTYWAELSEDVVIAQSGALTELESIYYTKLVGSWQKNGRRLVIDSLGEIQLSGGLLSTRAELVFTSAINDRRVLGHRIRLGQTSTDRGPQGESVNEYCGSLKTH